MEILEIITLILIIFNCVILFIHWILSRAIKKSDKTLMKALMKDFVEGGKGIEGSIDDANKTIKEVLRKIHGDKELFDADDLKLKEGSD